MALHATAIRPGSSFVELSMPNGSRGCTAERGGLGPAIVNDIRADNHIWSSLPRKRAPDTHLDQQDLQGCSRHTQLGVMKAGKGKREEKKFSPFTNTTELCTPKTITSSLADRPEEKTDPSCCSSNRQKLGVGESQPSRLRIGERLKGHRQDLKGKQNRRLS